MMAMAENTSRDITTLAKLFLSVRGNVSMKKFIQGLFTEGEISEFARRIEIVKMIKKGIPHHKIALTLGVGVATVTRGAREEKLGRFKNL